MSKVVHMDDESAIQLATAIVAMAVKDYCRAYMATKEGLSKIFVDGSQDYGPARSMKECETFFMDNWFEQLSSGLDGESIMRRMRQKSDEFMKLANEERIRQWGDEDEKDEHTYTCPYCKGKVKLFYKAMITHRSKPTAAPFKMAQYVCQWKCEDCNLLYNEKFKQENWWWKEWVDWLKRRKFLLCSAETANTEPNRKTARTAKTAK